MVGTGLYIRSATIAALDEWAQAEGRSRNNLIQRICDDALQRRDSIRRLAKAAHEINPVLEGSVIYGEVQGCSTGNQSSGSSSLADHWIGK
jgi:hypothetical protein